MDTMLPGLISYSVITPPTNNTNSVLYKLVPYGDVNDGGDYKVVGTVKEKNVPLNTPVFRKVRLFCAVSGRLVRETWSDKTTGEYSFLNMRYGPWFVVSHDHTKNFNAAIADSVVGEPM